MNFFDGLTNIQEYIESRVEIEEANSRPLVYGLLCPQTYKLRYVGRSNSDLNRPKRHAWNMTENNLCYGHLRIYRWISKLKRMSEQRRGREASLQTKQKPSAKNKCKKPAVDNFGNKYQRASATAKALGYFGSAIRRSLKNEKAIAADRCKFNYQNK